MKVIAFNWSVAKFDEKIHKLTIISPSASNEGVYYPASDVVIYGRDDLIALRDFLIEVLPLGSKPEF